MPAAGGLLCGGVFLAAALTVAGLMLFVFAELMQQAGEYKKENDMTI